MEPLAAYRLLAPEYDAAPNPLIALEQRTVRLLLPPLEGATMVDVAAGTGRWAAYCAGRGARTIAIDFCREMLVRARGPSVLGDAIRLPLRDACAGVTICAFALGYAPACLPELVRITRPGGAVLVTDVHPEAIRSGWTRSFRCGEEVIQVAHASYALDVLVVPGLRLENLLEVKIGAPERPIFERAGKADRFHEATKVPAVFVAKWTRV